MSEIAFYKKSEIEAVKKDRNETGSAIEDGNDIGSFNDPSHSICTESTTDEKVSLLYLIIDVGFVRN